MLGSHIDTNEEASSEVYIGRILQVALAGGVFRWLQIGCGASFEQRVQVTHRGGRGECGERKSFAWLYNLIP